MLIMSSDTRKGLVGVLVDETAISRVGQHTSLTYRGYEIQDLTTHCSFEEVAYLIIHGDLPDPKQLKKFQDHKRQYREISDHLIATIRGFPDSANPMARLRTAVSYLGMEDPHAEDNSPAANVEKTLKLLARIPTIVATDYRNRHGLERIAPDLNLGFVENFFNMCFGQIPEKEVLRCFDISLILYAELGVTPSTFTSRVVASSLSDMYSAITAAMGSLKGTLHGGANAAVMRMLLEIDTPEKAQAWVNNALANKHTIFGFGHRVYKRGDPRVPTLYPALVELARLKKGQKWMDIQETLAETMLQRRKLRPNVDYLTGLAYYLMGFDIDLFTPIFAMSRVTGWSAHVIEQLSSNKLIRPMSAYVGPAQRTIAPNPHLSTVR